MNQGTSVFKNTWRLVLQVFRKVKVFEAQEGFVSWIWLFCIANKWLITALCCNLCADNGFWVMSAVLWRSVLLCSFSSMEAPLLNIERSVFGAILLGKFGGCRFPWKGKFGGCPWKGKFGGCPWKGKFGGCPWKGKFGGCHFPWKVKFGGCHFPWKGKFGGCPWKGKFGGCHFHWKGKFNPLWTEFFFSPFFGT